MDLSNSFEFTMLCLLIIRMISLSFRDKFPMMSTIMYMVAHFIRSTINHNIDFRIVVIYQTIILHKLSTVIGYQTFVEFIKKL